MNNNMNTIPAPPAATTIGNGEDNIVRRRKSFTLVPFEKSSAPPIEITGWIERVIINNTHANTRERKSKDTLKLSYFLKDNSKSSSSLIRWPSQEEQDHDHEQDHEQEQDIEKHKTGKQRRKHNLWQTTCFEAFISRPASNSKAAQSPYWEINLSPSQDWNVYHFDNYREGMQEETRITELPVLEEQAIATASNQHKHRILSTEIDLRQLLLLPPINDHDQDHDFLLQEHDNTDELDIGITAVMETKTGETQKISFWALVHTGEEADFHRRDSFVLRI